MAPRRAATSLRRRCVPAGPGVLLCRHAFRHDEAGAADTPAHGAADCRHRDRRELARSRDARAGGSARAGAATHRDSTWNGCRGRGRGHRLHDHPPRPARRSDRKGVRKRSPARDASNHPGQRHEPSTCRTSRSFRALKPMPVFQTTPSIWRCSSTSIMNCGIRRRCFEASGGR